MLRIVSKNLIVLGVAMTFLSGCASSVLKARKEQREKAAQTSKLYCDFVNGEIYPDVEVMLNLEMAKRCDSERTFTITQYKTSNENMGVLYCCSIHDGLDLKAAEGKSTTDAKKAAKPAPAAAPAGAGAAKKSGPEAELGD